MVRGARVTASTPPDLAFAQQQSPQLAPSGWRPEFGDYLFVAFTTGTVPKRIAMICDRPHGSDFDGIR